MKRYITLAATAALFLAAQAQKQPYEDLLVKFVDEKYEDCLAKADMYVQRESTKKDALPYLYMSMCYYEMSKIEKYTALEEYKKADKEALKWAEKYRKKDKNKEYFDNYADFWSELNTQAQDKGLQFYDEGAKGMSKAKQTFDAMTGYYPENPGAWLMLGLTQLKTNLVKEGEISLTKFREALDAAGGVANLPEDQKKLMGASLIKYAEHLDSKGDSSGAKAAIALGADALKDDPEFKVAIQTYN